MANFKTTIFKHLTAISLLFTALPAMAAAAESKKVLDNNPTWDKVLLSALAIKSSLLSDGPAVIVAFVTKYSKV